MSYNLYWGDSHCNLHPFHIPRIDETFREAAGRTPRTRGDCRCEKP